MYLFREPAMPMLTLQKEEKPIIFRPFKSPLPGHIPQGLGQRTLGTRKRFAPGDTPTPRILKEDSPVKADCNNDCDVSSHRMVLWTPPESDSEGRREVVVDPMVSKVLREHQRIGVQFLFDCLMGLKDFDGCGCILADDMGLGKTLQSVSIMWTLLTQGGAHGKPACRKALVVCPASLVKNWAAEFDKWLHGRCKVTAIAESGNAKVSGSMSSFRYDRESKVLIASYETFRGHAKEVADSGIDLVVCDEAHKLKNDGSAITQCINGLSAKRRLLISGTPIQNNLEEFFTLVNVANPGIFGDYNVFRKRYAKPILRGREPTASSEERQVAQEKLQQVSEVTERFILRRTNRLNARFLPPKQLFNVFVAPSDFQQKLYHCFLRSNVARKLLDDGKLNRTVLVTIKRLQSLVNHPFLVRSAGLQKPEAGFDDEDARSLFAEIDAQDRGLRTQQRPVHEELSGKLQLLHAILMQIKAAGTGDRIVIISNWTSTLDLIGKMCDHNGWPTHRLDGSMGIGKRMKLVTDFNRTDNPKAFAFLLSSKAGGCGLNLIGANRLVMYDPDWNPANDRQAMARIWRDGQKKPCFIYRLFTTGTIDEKVYQRQICKDGLSTMMVTETGEDEPAEMLRESLDSDLVKDLFSYSEDTACATHDMLECKRCPAHLQAGRVSRIIDVADEDLAENFVPQEADVVEDELCTWSHHPNVQGVPDNILRDAAKRCTGRGVTFVMGCHIEYTPEMIAKLEEEDRVLQEQREAKAAAKKESQFECAQDGKLSAKVNEGGETKDEPVLKTEAPAESSDDELVIKREAAAKNQCSKRKPQRRVQDSDDEPVIKTEAPAESSDDEPVGCLVPRHALTADETGNQGRKKRQRPTWKSGDISPSW
jgi:DNA repair and recombination RAD54-like protein